MPKEVYIADGTFDFSGGVNSNAVTTVRSDLNPNGLQRNQLAWLSNATVRGGAILQRTGWQKLLDLIQNGLWQGGIMYETFDNTSNPRIVCSISGHIYSVLLDPPFTVTDLSVKFGLFNPATVDEAFFVEAEGFLLIQAGDFLTAAPATLPLIYRSPFGGQPEIMRRSRGLNGNVITPPLLQEIPAAMAMEYYQGRIWYAQGRLVSAGDIVGSPFSGTAPYNFRDSVTRVTENPLAIGGDGFTVPSQAGNIRALKYTANQDSSLGQGPLYIFTRKQVYSLAVPVSRDLWVKAGNDTAPPHGTSATNTGTAQLIPVQINNGSAGERGIARINGDLYYQSFDPAVRSLIVATRYFQQPGNTSISINEIRALNFENRALMRFNTSFSFDNRALFGSQAKQTPSGVVVQGFLPLNFDSVSSLEERRPAVWEGIWEGIPALQAFTGDFGGLERAFAVIVSNQDTTIDVWELTQSSRTENGDNRIGWYAEFPAFTWSTAGWELELKKLRGAEIWISRVVGTVELTFYYRPDSDPCWHLWFETSFCAARNCAEDINNPVCYPVGPPFGEGYEWPIELGEPPEPACNLSLKAKRPTDVGYQFQTKVVVKGFCQIRGLVLYATQVEKAPPSYQDPCDV
jgi:hypothetical protein